MPEHDRQLAWVVGEWKSHNSNQKINWDEVLDLTCFELQKIIVSSRWRGDFERNWLHYLVATSRRRSFRELKEEAEEYCRRKVQSSRYKTAQAGEFETRWSPASPAAFSVLFPHFQVRKSYSSQKKRSMKSTTRSMNETSARRSRISLEGDISVTDRTEGVKEGNPVVLPVNFAMLEPLDVTLDDTDDSLIKKRTKTAKPTKTAEPHPERESFDMDTSAAKLAPKPSVEDTTHDRNTLLRWEPNKFDAVAPPPTVLSEELKELAFLLEQAVRFKIASSPWNHVFDCMSPTLRKFVESKSPFVSSFRDYGHKLRRLVGERLSVRRVALDSYRITLSETVFSSSAGKASKEKATIDASQLADSTPGATQAANISPVKKPLVAVEVIAVGPQNEVPTRVDITDGRLPDAASELTANVLEDIATHSYVASRPTHVGTVEDTLQSARSYVSTMRSYQLFSSSMRREAHLFLHISQWQTWHLTDHSTGSVFATTQRSVFNAFRDDELHLSKQASKNAVSHIIHDDKALLDLAKEYSLLRDNTWKWWCALVHGCCVEFTTQAPRLWNDFEYTQRSLWEYAMQLETAMRDFHFQQCLKDPRSSLDATNTAVLLEQAPATTLFQGAEAGQSIHHYVASLNNYLNLSTKVRNPAFMRSYLTNWKVWLEGRNTSSRRVSFLEGEEMRLDVFQGDENTLVTINFRGPYLRSFDGAFGRPLFARGIELYLTLREKLWYFFCREILWESWKDCTSKEHPIYDEFEKSQIALWEYFEQMERAILKVHRNRCSQLVRAY